MASMIPSRPSSWLLLLLIPLLCAGAALLLGGASPPAAQDGDDDEEQQEAEEAESSFTDEERRAISSTFHASSVEFPSEGRVRLIYDFDEQEEDLLLDWTPPIEKTNRRIRWSKSLEGTWSTVERAIVIADLGVWLHKGVWKEDVRMEIDYLSMSGTRSGDLCAVVYAYDKGKRLVGSNFGKQCVRLSKSLKLSGKPIPLKPWPMAAVEDRFTFGIKLEGGVLYSLRNGYSKADTAEKPKFLKKLSVGRVGIAFRGRVNGFIFKITIEGVPDPEWLKKRAS